jgi:hypothetical protein
MNEKREVTEVKCESVAGRCVALDCGCCWVSVRPWFFSAGLLGTAVIIRPTKVYRPEYAGEDGE